MKNTLNNPLKSHSCSPGLALLLGGLLLGLAPARLPATIPAAALADPRYGLGYLVATYYAGVTNDGSGDCTAGIQAAIADAYAANAAFAGLPIYRSLTNVNPTVRPLAVFFPPGTYTISNTLQCYQWDATNGMLRGYHMVIGSTAGTNRPVLKLAANAPNFTNPAAPRQMIAFGCWQQKTGAYPPVAVNNPMTPPSGYADFPGANMQGDLRNLDFDCNGNAGAVGVTMSGAQWVTVENVKVSATNAFAGFYETPGAGGYAANLEVAGGQYGVIEGTYGSLGLNLEACAGATIAGLTLENQTAKAILFYDECSPMTVIGFNFTNTKNVETTNYYYTADGVMTLIDGQIGINSATNLMAFDNGVGKDFYLRNVYVTGTTNLVRSSTNMTAGAGAWSYIAEYSYNNTAKQYNVPPNSNYTNGAVVVNSYSLINGTLGYWTNSFPVPPNIVTNSAAPPADLVSRHLWASFPSYNGATNDPATVVVSTNAGYLSTNDSTVLLQTNIDLASTNATYNGRVFLPAGVYYITNTLTLHTNTVLIGVGRGASVIQGSQAWKPTSNVTMVQTEDSASATTTLAFLDIIMRYTVIQSDTNYSWFNAVTWRAGANSLVLGIDPDTSYSQWTNTWPRQQILITNNGGGKWYGVALPREGDEGPNANHLYRKVKVAGTTQPLWFYAFNLEHGGNSSAPSDEDGEITGASNVRFVGMKREGETPLLMITNCTNIAAYGFGFNGSDPNLGNGNGYFQVVGASTNILLANLTDMVGGPGTHNMLYEAVTGQPTNAVLWPNHISLYKRGQINDTNMFIGGGPPATPAGLAAVKDLAYPSMEMDVSWNSVANETSYTLSRSTTSGGPYSPVASPTATNYTDATVFPGTTYYYVVAANNASGSSPNSAQVSAATRTNAPPTLNAIANLTTNMNAPQQVVNLANITPGANESGVQAVTNVTASSSNTGLIPNPTVSYTSPNTTGTLTFMPVANASGTATVTVTAQDNGGTAGGGVNTVTQTFTVTITLVAPAGLTATNDAAYPSMQLDVSWNSVPSATGYILQRSTSSSGPYAVVANTAATTYNDTGVFPGTTYYYEVAATNSGGQSPFSSPSTAATTRTNAAPTLNVIANLTTNMNAPQQVVNLAGIGPGANESGVQAITNVTASSSNTGLIPNPAVSYSNPNTTGTLTFTPVANASGTATVTVTVQDNGGTAGGGVNTVTQSFLVTITSGGSSIYSNVVNNVDINTAMWTANGGGTTNAPSFGNTYVVPATNMLFTTNSATTPNLVRAVAATGSGPYSEYFQGDSLSLGSNWLMKLKTTSGSGLGSYTFTNSTTPGSAGLILNGGLVEDGDGDGAVKTLSGVLAAANGTLSYLSLSGNEFYQPGSDRSFAIGATVVGNGAIMICGGTNGSASYNVATFTNAAPASAFSGTWIVEGGYMTTAAGAGAGAYGANCSFIVDNKYPIPTTNWGNTATAPSARLDLSIPVTSTGTLIVTNSGQLYVNAAGTFSTVTIAGTSLAAGSYTASTLAGLFPANMVAGGSGTLTVSPLAAIYSNTVPCSVDINSNMWLNGGSTCYSPAFGSGGVANDYVIPSTNLLFSNTGTVTNLVRAYATNTTSPYTMYFWGDSLSLGGNWLLKLKGPWSGAAAYTAYTFTNSITPASPGLLLNGGMIEDGETTSVQLTNQLFGVVGAANGTLSYLSFSGTEFYEAGTSGHSMSVAATLAGNGNLMICGGSGAALSSAGYYNYVIFTNAPTASTFSGTWIIEGGWMTTASGAAAGAYGVNCSFIVDNLYPTPVPWGNTATTNSARLDLSIPVTSTGTLIVTNSGQLFVNAAGTFNTIAIAGTWLTANSNYTAATLSAMFPGNVISGGSGTLKATSQGHTIKSPAPFVFSLAQAGKGGQLVLSGSGGSTNGTYRVLSSANPALPLASWTPVLTNSFGGAGSFSNPITINSAEAQRFYRLVAP